MLPASPPGSKTTDPLRGSLSPLLQSETMCHTLILLELLQFSSQGIYLWNPAPDSLSLTYWVFTNFGPQDLFKVQK